MTGVARPVRARRSPEKYALDVSRETRVVPLAVARLKRIARAALAAENVAAATLSIAVVDNRTIRRLNRRFLGHDYETDVLSFLFGPAAYGSGSRKPRRGRGLSIDGEVIVSAEMAQTCAQRLGASAAAELALYLVHGVLHLCGYDDRTKAQRRAMMGRERAVLESLGIRAAKRGEEADP